MAPRMDLAVVKNRPILSPGTGPAAGAATLAKERSWHLVATEDRMIPTGQREMSERAGPTVVEVAGSHAIYVSQPAAVADLIKKLVAAVGEPAAAPLKTWPELGL